MAIDLVAVYAALVATASASWQAFQWRSDRRERQAARKGELTVEVLAFAHDRGADVTGKIINHNDYPIRVRGFFLRSVPANGKYFGDPDEPGHVVFFEALSLEAVGRPSTIEPHDGVEFSLDYKDLNRLVPLMRFTPKYRVSLEVDTSVGTWSSGSSNVIDATGGHFHFDGEPQEGQPTNDAE